MKFSKKHLLLLCAFLVNVVFFLQDSREPMDLGHYYRQLPDWIGFFQGNGTVSLLDLVTASGSWLNAVWAGLISLGLVGKTSFMCFGLFWLGVFLYNIRKFDLLPISFILMMPIWSIGSRSAWLHFIELSLFLVLWNVKKKTGLLFLVSMLLVWLRPTSMVWFLLLVLLWSLLNDIKKIKALVAGGIVGLAIVGMQLPAYIEGKMHVLHVEHSLGEELMAQCFRTPLLLCVIGCFFLFRYSKRSFEENFLFISILMGFILALAFGVGIDNFLVVHFALGYLGGRGWQGFLKEKKKKKLGQELLSDLSLFIVIAPLIPQKFVKWAQLPLHETVYENKPWEVLRVQKHALNLEHVMPFFDKICVDRWIQNETCNIVSSQGMFHPMREEDGSLALTLANIPNLNVSNAGLWWTRQDLAKPDPLQGIVLFDCASPPDQKSSFRYKEKMLKALPEKVKTEIVGELPLPNCPVTFFKMTEENLQEKLQKMGDPDSNQWIIQDKPENAWE